MKFYDLFGTINTTFILVSLWGVYSQLKTIWQRKNAVESKDQPTELLSLNQFFVSFLAYFSFFVYGYSIEPFNHYIVWPRLLASLLVAYILYEIWQDRRSRAAKLCHVFAQGVLVVGVAASILGGSFNDESKLISTVLIVVITLFIAQGYFHQILLIWWSGRTGAVDLKMSQFILMMDISTIAFALSIGLKDGWPLLLLAIVSGITKLVIMFLFRWVRVSSAAKRKRALQLA